MNYLWTFIPGCFAMVGLAFITQGLFFLRGQNRTFISSIEVDVEVISLRPFHNSDTGSDAYLAEYEVISGPYSGTRHLTQYPANPPLHDLGDRPRALFDPLTGIIKTHKQLTSTSGGSFIYLVMGSAILLGAGGIWFQTSML